MMRGLTLSNFPRNETAIIRALLSPAELEVWRLTALGESMKEIADAPGSKRTFKTVMNQRMSLYRKLNIHSVADATRLAIRHRIIDVEVLPS